MSVLVGYVPTPEGEAALQTAIAEARLRETSLVVLNASSGDAIADPHHVTPDVVARIEKELADSGVPHTVEVRSGRDPVDEIVTLAEDHRPTSSSSACDVATRWESSSRAAPPSRSCTTSTVRCSP